jgi:hypothetical protein
MSEIWTVSVNGVVSQGWFTGFASRHMKGERSVNYSKRPISCRVEDAPAEVAELFAWMTKPRDLHPQLDL